MHDDLETFSQKPTQKFCDKPNNFEKPQIFNTNPEVRSKTWNAWWMSEKETKQKQKMRTKTEKHLGWRFGVRERGFGRWRDWKYQERSRWKEKTITQILYIEKHNSRQIERCRGVSRIKKREKAVEELSRIYQEVSTAKGSRWIKVAIEKLSNIQKVSRWIEVAIEKLSRMR